MNGFRPVKYIADTLRKLIGGATGCASLLPVNIKNKLKFNQQNNSMWAIIPLGVW